MNTVRIVDATLPNLQRDPKYVVADGQIASWRME